jgi:hypothetical protein|tara:strand:- start:3919 stop:4461 length:543 start_codon:yes stop_codon:yes gene_type:complete
MNVRHQLVFDDIRSWSREVLEVSNPHLSGLKACPYAENAWSKKRVDVLIGEGPADLKAAIDSFDSKSFDVTVWVNFNLSRVDLWDRWVQMWNKKNVSRDIHLMLFHPGFPPSEETEEFLTDNDWESDVDDDYMMVFIQSLSALNKASMALESIGYYNHFADHLYETLVLDRRRLSYGDGS